MHIGYITTEYPHKKLSPVGGIGTFIKNMALKLTEKGHKVTIFLCLADNNQIWDDDAIQIVEIGKVTNTFIPEFIASRYKINKVIKTYIQSDNIDLIEAPDWEGLHAFCKFKIPLVTRIHGSATYFSNLTNRPYSKVMKFIENRGFGNSNYIVSVSNYAAEKTKELFQFSSRNIKVIHLGTDLVKFSPLDNNRIQNPPLLLHIGTLVRKKGVLDLPHIFNEIHNLHPEYELLILGKDTIDSIANKSVWALMKESFTKKALSKVTYLGPVSSDVVKNYIASATACVFTSYAETFGLVTTESMAMEKPVIIYDFPWVREIINHNKDGILIESNNFIKSAQIISETLNDKVIMNTLGTNARQKVEEKFDLNKKFKENLEFYTKVINGK